MESFASIPLQHMRVYIPIELANRNWCWDDDRKDCVCTVTGKTLFEVAGIVPEYVSDTIVVYGTVKHPYTDITTKMTNA